MSRAGCEPDGQMKLMRDAAFGLRDAAREKRESIDARVETARRIIDAAPADEHFVIWHDLEDERRALTAGPAGMCGHLRQHGPGGTERRVEDFAYGRTRLFATKKSLSGSGCNFQRYCHRAIFFGD